MTRDLAAPFGPDHLELDRPRPDRSPPRRDRHRASNGVTCGVLRRLDDEWVILRRRPASLTRVRSWSQCFDGEPDTATLATIVSGIRDLDDLLHATWPNRARRDTRRGRRWSRPDHGVVGADDGRVIDVDSESVLRALVRIARTDTLALRVVVQRVLPALVNAGRRTVDRDIDDHLEQLVGAAAIAVATVDIDRRSGPVVPMIVSDARWIAHRRAERRRDRIDPIPLGGLDFLPAPPEELDPLVALARTVRHARESGVDDEHLGIVRDIARSTSIDDVASLHGVTDRTIRTRRSDAVSSIRRTVVDGWCPAADGTAVA